VHPNPTDTAEFIEKVETNGTSTSNTAAIAVAADPPFCGDLVDCISYFVLQFAEVLVKVKTPIGCVVRHGSRMHSLLVFSGGKHGIIVLN
jgi:hypothetical protein